jgi:predicted RNase H-like nuclease (RuvC/YqgF family)
MATNMTSLEQAEALIKEYAELIKTQQGEIIGLQREIKHLRGEIDELRFELMSELNKEYDC